MLSNHNWMVDFGIQSVWFIWWVSRHHGINQVTCLLIQPYGNCCIRALNCSVSKKNHSWQYCFAKESQVQTMTLSPTKWDLLLILHTASLRSASTQSTSADDCNTLARSVPMWPHMVQGRQRAQKTHGWTIGNKSGWRPYLSHDFPRINVQCVRWKSSWATSPFL